jgi:hypothetical protein
MAINNPIAHAETKQITSPYENSFCQFQRMGSIVLSTEILLRLDRPCWANLPCSGELRRIITKREFLSKP